MLPPMPPMPPGPPMCICGGPLGPLPRPPPGLQSSHRRCTLIRRTSGCGCRLFFLIMCKRRLDRERRHGCNLMDGRNEDTSMLAISVRMRAFVRLYWCTFVCKRQRSAPPPPPSPSFLACLFLHLRSFLKLFPTTCLYQYFYQYQSNASINININPMPVAVGDALQREAKGLMRWGGGSVQGTRDNTHPPIIIGPPCQPPGPPPGPACPMKCDVSCSVS